MTRKRKLQCASLLICSFSLISSCDNNAESNDADQVQSKHETDQPQLDRKPASETHATSANIDPENQRLIEEARRVAEDAARIAKQPTEKPQVINGPPFPGDIDLQPILGSALLPYMPAHQSDMDEGKLIALLAKHKLACKNRDPIALFSLFTQSVRYGFSRMSKQKLGEYYQYACQDETEFFEDALKQNKLRISESRQTQQGKKISELCIIEENQECTGSADVGIENGDLKWAEW